MLSDLVFRLRALFQRSRVEAEMNEELQSHFEQEVEKLLNAGLTREEAQRQARLAFGGLDQAKEECREARGIAFIETTLQDLRFGLRQLRRNPGFTVVAIITLALGIGATTAIFSLVNAVLLRPLPYRNASSLVAVTGVNSQGNQNWTTPADFFDWQRENHTFSQMTACMPRAGGIITGGTHTGNAMGFYVDTNFFKLLGVNAILGRTFVPADENEKVVVLNHALWMQQFGGDPRVIGKKIEINHQPFTVVGVLPANFWFFYRQVQLWIPMHLRPAQAASRKDHLLLVFARLKPTATVRRAQADMTTITKTLGHEYPQDDGGWGVKITVLRESFLVGATRPALLVLLAAVGLLLLIACANVANLLLVRGSVRRQEFAVRIALGASHSRVVRQALTEGFLITAIGGALGLAAAVASSKLMLALLPARFVWWMPMLTPGQSLIDLKVLVFAGLIVLVSWICTSLVPAIWSTSFDAPDGLKSGARIGAPGGRKARSLLVILEAALTAALLAASGLLIKSFILIERTDPGFRVDNILTVETGLPRFEHPSEAQQVAFYAQTLQRIATVPGVVSVALGDGFDLPPTFPGDPIAVEGKIAQSSTEIPHAIARAASAGYFWTIQIPLVKGRTFAASDNAAAPRVAILSEDLVHRLWPHEDPIGRRIKIGTSSRSPWLTIMGVVGDTRYQGLEEQPTPSVYLPYRQRAPRWGILVVRTEGDPIMLALTIRKKIRSLDKAARVTHVMTMERTLAETVWQTRFATLVLGFFAALAMALAAVGIYGVVSYTTAQRTHEIGIRMALGAQKSDVLRLVLGQGMILTLIGVGIGIIGALGLTRFLSSLLYGVKPTDPLTFVAVSLLLTGVALLACYIPARRAANVDPMVALRYE